MNKADLIGGVALLAAGLALIFLVIPLGTVEGAFFGLSPTVFPTIIASGMVLSSVGLIVHALARLRAGGEEPPLPVTSWNMLMFTLSAGITLAGVIAIDVLGIEFGGPLLIGGLMIFLGERNPIRIVLTSVIPVLVVVLLVTHVFHSVLP